MREHSVKTELELTDAGTKINGIEKGLPTGRP
jgi:hypothetical protein